MSYRPERYEFLVYVPTLKLINHLQAYDKVNEHLSVQRVSVFYIPRHCYIIHHAIVSLQRSFPDLCSIFEKRVKVHLPRIWELVQLSDLSYIHRQCPRAIHSRDLTTPEVPMRAIKSTNESRIAKKVFCSTICATR